MRVLGALFTIIGVAICVALLLPVLGVGIALAAGFGGIILWLLPILFIAGSDQVSNSEKILWILAIVFLSWFAWIFYFFFAPVFDRPRRYRYY